MCYFDFPFLPVIDLKLPSKLSSIPMCPSVEIRNNDSDLNELQ